MSGSKRAPSAYFIFGGEHRVAIKEALLAERRKECGDDAKVSVADVAKEIGRRWKELSEEERQRYKDMSADKAKELAEHGTEKEETIEPDTQSKKQESMALLPLSMVKKLVCRDEEVKRVSGDAVRIVAEATGMFLGVLASKSLAHATSQKRKNFKFSDIEYVSRKDRRMMDMGLPLSFESEKAFVQGDASGTTATHQNDKVNTEGTGKTNAPVGIQKFFGIQDGT